MSQNEQPIEWFLARDGQRHGPISDVEIRKFIELGHLKPTDLVWRMGFANWELAANVFPPPPPRPAPPPPAANPSPPPPRQPMPTQRPASGAMMGGDPAQSPRQAPAANGTGAGPQGHGQHQAGTGAPSPRPADREGPNGDDPMRHRRLNPQTATDPQTRRASAYGEPAPQHQPTGGGHTGPASPSHGQPHLGPQASQGSAPEPWPSQATRTGPPGSAPGPSSGAHAPGAHPQAAPPMGARSPVPPNAGPFQPEIDSSAPLLGDDDPAPPPKRRKPWGLVITLLAMILIVGTVYGLHKTGRLNLGSLPGMAPANKTLPVVKAPKEAFKESPLRGFAGSAAEVDANYQKTALWQILKREFPDWYNARVAETVKLRSEGKDDAAIAVQLSRSMVELRRKHVAQALAAKPVHLRQMAQTFVDNLERLSKVSTEACYRFISGGETDPMMIEMMRSPEHTASMQTQMISIFEAIVDGRTSKMAHPPAERKDYDLLAAQLSVRGWSPADLALFDDARALSKAAPQKVCQMVQDWFLAQLAIRDEAVQSRLFTATLRPLIGE